MDLQAALICIGVALFSAIIIYVISVFSMREKTYEEAIAEQRKMPEEHLLLGRSAKDKAKDKKLKKLGKKVKEKNTESEKSVQNDTSAKSSTHSAKVHVDFEEPEAEVVSEHHPQEDKKKKKKEKVKPILVNKDEPSLVVEKPLTPINHFEEILPKDDLLLKRKESREEQNTKGGSEPSVKEEVKTSPKVTKVENTTGGNKQEAVTKTAAAKTESIPVQKGERSQASKNERSSGEKEKGSGEKEKGSAEAKQEKVPPKTEKSASKTEKAPAAKVEKQAAAKSEKIVPAKSDKPSAKNEKAVAEKPEKTAAKGDKAAKVDNVSPKPEKSAPAKVEKGASSKQEKNSAKGEKQSASKTDKTGAAQEPSNTTSAQQTSNSATAPVRQSVAAPVVKHEVAQTQTSPPPKEKSRKKKSELAALQQMTGDRDGVNVSLLLPLVQKAELSRSEIQILIDHLLNKQQNAGVSDAEWIEGRQDPVVKLKKQLAEKEKALAEEQEASQGVQAKLKELRLELNTERSRLTHTCRQLEENLTAKTNEAHALATRLQHAQDTANNEKQALNLQLQQLQQKLNDEHVRLIQVEEQESVVRQDLLNQQQQLDIRINHFTEKENALKSQVTQLMGQLKEQETINSSLKVELQNQRDQHISENNMLHERVAHSEKQLVMFKENAERTQELAHQVEDLTCVRGDLEHRLSSIQKHEATLQFDVNNLHKEVDELKAQLVGYESLKNEANGLRADNDKLSTQLLQNKDLQMENQRLHDENERLASQLVGLPELQRKALQLREENESLAAQVTAMTERPAAEGRENGDLQLPEEKQEIHKGDFTQFEKTIQQKESLILQMEGEVEKQSSLIETLQSEVNTCRTHIGKLSQELQEQKKRNDEAVLKAREEEQLMVTQLLQRIFPDVEVQGCKTHSQWLEKFEQCVKSMVAELRSRATEVVTPVTESEQSSSFMELEKQNNHLQGLVTNYKAIIGDTEGMLKKLQNQVEDSEIRWRQQMQVKEAELEAVRQELEASVKSAPQSNNTAETQKKFDDLQSKLQIQGQQKQEVEEKYAALCSHIEEVKEENTRLSLQLKKEEEKAQDLSKELVKFKSLVQIGRESLSQEREMIVQLQQQVDKLTGTHQNHNMATNGPSTESSSLTVAGSGKK